MDLTGVAGILSVLILAPAAAGPNASTSPAEPRLPGFMAKAPALPPPEGPVIRVSTVPELMRALQEVKPGGTILLSDGRYRLSRFVELKTDRVTLRGASGDRAAVVLDGGGIGELVWITRAAGVTIADLTIENAKWNGFKINSETGVQRLTIRNCVIHNIWQRGVKGVKVPAEGRERLRPTGGRVEYCLFYNDRPKTFADDPADTPENFGGNYVGGIDLMYAKDWVIRDNVFVGIKGRTGAARGAVFLWHEAENCVVERNLIVDCDSGVCLGNSHKPPDVPVHATRCLVRNNFLARVPENGLLADYTRDCRIVNNTVFDPKSRLGRLIRIVHDNDGLLVANNLLCGPRIRNESSCRIEFAANLDGDFAAAFADPAAGDLHLKAPPASVRDQARPLPDVPDDIDRQPRGDRPDIGADEAP